MNLRKLVTTSTLAILATSTAVVAPTVSGADVPAFAACPEVGSVSYKFSAISRAWLGTNLHSDYLTGPGSITYSKQKTSTVTGTYRATGKVEVDLIVLKFGAEAGPAISYSVARSASWSYRAEVPAGRTKRLQQYKEARSFTVQKREIVAPCNVKTVWSRKFTAPMKSNTYRWALAG